MASVSGLPEEKRDRVRDRVCQALKLGLAHRDKLHYTMDGRRWEGIEQHRDAHLGQFPAHSDCSSFATWALWNGLFLMYGRPDNVNGHHWNAGYTGTMMNHGWRLPEPLDPDDMRRGDCVFYAGTNFNHVAVVLNRKADGTLMVVSHGSEAGPDYRKYNYRHPILGARRYI
jgi:cell wall-associated NlpC family hydrolase